MKDKKICCICGKPFDGYGNNPAPVMDGGECCHKCGGSGVVLPRLTDKKLAEIAKRFSEASK